MSSCSHRMPSPIREFNTSGRQHKSEDGQKILRDHDFPKNWVLPSVYVFYVLPLSLKNIFTKERKKEIFFPLYIMDEHKQNKTTTTTTLQLL